MRPAVGEPSSSRRSVVALLAAWALGAWLVGAPALAERVGDDDVKEYKLKAYFLAHFVGYTTWPKAAFEKEDSPFVLLVIGEDPFGEQLEKSMEKVRLGKHAVRIERRAQLEELPRAHMVFLARSNAKDLDALLEHEAVAGALLVSDSDGHAELGAHVNFFLDDKHLRFAVNNDAAKRAGLSISSEMLKLARIVKDKRKRELPEEDEP